MTFRDAVFNRATFKRGAVFNKATFQNTASFILATFESDALFITANFHDHVTFAFATFKGDAKFDEATFQGHVSFRAIFEGDATFDHATFERAEQFGPLVAHRGLSLNSVRFAQHVRIEASTIGLCCRQTRFLGGVQFRLRWAVVLLDDTDLDTPSLLTGIPRSTRGWLAGQQDIDITRWRQVDLTISERPRLLSLQRANVAGLGLANVDLADCRFVGAHNLDKLHLEADVTFAVSPVRPRWDQRQVIAEERAWRRHHSKRSGQWTAPWWPDQACDAKWLRKAIAEPPGVLDAGTIAGLYRALRKGREDTKDEPGAADFYYGEMEMRRHPATEGGGSTSRASRGRMERGVITSYWLVSGYGLRAWRALAWLAGLTAAFGVGFHLIGFTQPPQPATYWTSWLYSLRSTISFTDVQVRLTAWGLLLQTVLRLTGPVLLGLALLALRNRVRR